MSKIIYTYEHEGRGKFAESVTVSLNKDGSAVISVYGAPLIDGNYREPGDFATMTLPVGQVAALIEALLAIAA